MNKSNIHNSKQAKEIISLLESIAQQHQKNQQMFSKLIQSSSNSFEIIDAQQFIFEIETQLRNQKFAADVLIRKCQEMIDQLLNEEYNLDRELTKLKSRRRRNNKASTGDVLQQIDQNVKDSKQVEEKQKQLQKINEENKEDKIIVKFIPPIEMKPIDKLINLNYQVEYCINLLNRENDLLDDDLEVIDLKCQLQQLTENKVYSDENVDVYVVYKDGMTRTPHLQIQY